MQRCIVWDRVFTSFLFIYFPFVRVLILLSFTTIFHYFLIWSVLSRSLNPSFCPFYHSFLFLFFLLYHSVYYSFHDFLLSLFLKLLFLQLAKQKKRIYLLSTRKFSFSFAKFRWTLVMQATVFMTLWILIIALITSCLDDAICTQKGELTLKEIDR